MTEEERKEVSDKLMEIGRAIVSRESGDLRDIATVGTISALVYAISEGREVELSQVALGLFTDLDTASFLAPKSDTSH